jgi:hypothetical protein
MAETTPKFSGGTAPITMQASAAVTGGRLVENTGATAGGQVGPAGAASTKVVGYAGHDQATVGGKVAVWPLAGLVFEILCTGTVNAGDNVNAGAAGVVAAIGAGTFPTLVGVALTGGTDTTIRVLGR